MPSDLAGGRSEATERAFCRRGRRLDRRHLAMVNSQDRGFIVIDSTSILANIAGIVNTAGKFAKVSVFDGLKTAQTDFGRFCDLLKRNAAISANRGEPEDGRFVVHLVP